MNRIYLLNEWFNNYRQFYFFQKELNILSFTFNYVNFNFNAIYYLIIFINFNY
jgi:hypothetical protein